MAQNIVRLDEGEEEESEVTQEAQAEMGGGGRNRKRREDRRQMRRRWKNWGEGTGEKERACAPRVEGDEREMEVEKACCGGPEHVGTEPERLREEGERRRVEK